MGCQWDAQSLPSNISQLDGGVGKKNPKSEQEKDFLPKLIKLFSSKPSLRPWSYVCLDQAKLAFSQKTGTFSTGVDLGTHSPHQLEDTDSNFLCLSLVGLFFMLPPSLANLLKRGVAMIKIKFRRPESLSRSHTGTGKVGTFQNNQHARPTACLTRTLASTGFLPTFSSAGKCKPQTSELWDCLHSGCKEVS